MKLRVTDPTIRWLRTHPRRGTVVVIAIVVIASALWIRLGRIPADLLDERVSTSTVVVDRRGVPLYEALSGEGTRSTRIEADRLPPLLVAATIAAEDRRFWSHV